MSGLILKLKDYTAPSELGLPIYYPDAVMDEDSVYVIDSLDTTCWPTQDDASASDEIVNLVAGGDSAVFNFSSVYTSGDGFAFTLSGSQRIVLPSDAVLTGYNGGFAWGIWVVLGAQTQVTNPIGGWYNDSTIGLGGYGLRFQSGTSYRAIIGTNEVVVGNDIRQVVVARVLDGSDYSAVVYKNGVRVFTAAMSSTFDQPSSPAAEASLGDVESTGGDGGTWIGEIGRSWMTKKTYTTVEMDALVAKDWALNNTRYS